MWTGCHSQVPVALESQDEGDRVRPEEPGEREAEHRLAQVSHCLQYS